MRSCTPLMRGWQFALLPHPCEVPPDMAPQAWSTVDLPHVWNHACPEQSGCCLYQTKWHQERKAGCRFFLAFDAVGGVARVFLNGVFLGEHRGGYSRFCFDATPAMRQGENCLQVLADNTGYQNVNPLMGDFTVFGGIYRPVTVLQTGACYFDPTHYGTLGLDVDANADGSVVVNARVVGGESAEIEYVVTDAGGARIAAARVSAQSPTAKLAVERPRRWDGLTDPYLYKCTASLWCNGTVCDSVTLPFGFRAIALTPDSGFFLNGRHVKLKGVAKHQDFAGMGCAPTAEQLDTDFALIREIGANAVRLSHYQHPQYAYDKCDEAGFVVWAEIPMLAMPDGNSAIVENAAEQLTELILQNKHHPCICFWGVQNEIAMRGESLETYQGVKRLNNLAKTLDATRITAGANLYSVKNSSQLNFLNDAIGYNVYFGWYYGVLGDYAHFLEQFHKENPTVPLGITEYGVDCNLQYHTDVPICKDYTEEFQCAFHEASYAAIAADEKLWGSFVWNMFDFSSAIRDEGGVKAQNSKGLVTYDRQIKKDSFYYYKACWAQKPFVHVTGRRYKNRCGQTTTVKVYSNQRQVMLLANGVRVGCQEGSGVFVFQNIPLHSRTVLCAVAGQCRDEITLCRVSAPDSRYVYPKKGEGQRVTNWFTHLTSDAVATDEEAYSLSDSIGDLLADPRTAALLEEYLPEIVHDERTRMYGGMSLLRILDRNASLCSEQMLQKLHQGVNQIRKVQ